MSQASMLLEALFYSLQAYEKIVGRATTFVCSRDIYELLDEPEFILGKVVEIDECLCGYTSDSAWYWM